ncbi:MAG: aldo/keto reductase [Phycisphaerae bacterium]|jgi:predicted aldo/keto reductase-like oxidoreductase|nr:aldo/keto reductase [Phycisphaerae bacterium]
MTPNSNERTRREFLKTAAAASSATVLASAASPILGAKKSGKSPTIKPADAIPKRVLGKTGMKVSVLSFGGGSQFLKNKDGAWEPLLQRAVDLGINYFDTHQNYKTEERFGEILPKYRKKIYIVTKFDPRDEDGMMKSFEGSLKRLKVDYVDALLLHNLGKEDDLKAFAKGAWKRMQKLKSEGTARFIGFSSMRSAAASRNFIEQLNPDIALVAMNATRYAGFAKLTLKPAVKNNVGVIAMKTVRGLIGQKGATPKKLLQYVLDQKGVASAVVGHYGMKVLEENVKLVKEIIQSRKMSPAAKKRLETACAPLAGPHALPWARADYLDDGISYA